MYVFYAATIYDVRLRSALRDVTGDAFFRSFPRHTFYAAWLVGFAGPIDALPGDIFLILLCDIAFYHLLLILLPLCMAVSAIVPNTLPPPQLDQPVLTPVILRSCITCPHFPPALPRLTRRRLVLLVLTYTYSSRFKLPPPISISLFSSPRYSPLLFSILMLLH